MLMYGKASRNALFYNPSYFEQQIDLLSLQNHPDHLFDQQNNNIEWISQKRKARLKRASARCREIF